MILHLHSTVTDNLKQQYRGTKTSITNTLDEVFFKSKHQNCKGHNK